MRAKRRIFTPADYTKAFLEGKVEGLAKGLDAVSPYLVVGTDDEGGYGGMDAFGQAQVMAWEHGWWSVCEKLTRGAPPPDKPTLRYWAAVAVVCIRSLGRRLRGSR